MTDQSETLPILLLKAREKAIGYVRPVLADLDLTEQQWRVIRALFGQQSTTTQALADHSCILGPSLSRILTKLEMDGLILRKSSKSDHRVVNIKLSSKGKRLHGQIFRKLQLQYAQFNDDHGVANVEKLNGLLEQFVN